MLAHHLNGGLIKIQNLYFCFMISVSIITIGDELLIGQVIDTNSAWIAQELNKIGIPVLRRVAVGDNFDQIWNTLNEESQKSKVILITGGLGPTADDITKPLLCKYFDGKMVINNDALENVTHLFEKIFKRPLTERNIKQAEVPNSCKVLINPRGTAPGMLFEKKDCIFISMPGVPHEMKGIMIDHVIPLLLEKFELPHISHRTLVTFGIGESMLADLIQSYEEKLPTHIKLAYLPNYGIVRLRLTSSGKNKDAIENEIEQLFCELLLMVKDYLVTNEDEPMEKVVAKLLLKNNQTLSTAESCTGGFLSHLITSIPGSSAYFLGSIVSYSNLLKENLLDVKNITIELNGAVSEAVVIEMAKGALKKLNTTYTIALSGIMGPDGGSTEKPVGTVWIAVGNQESIITKQFHFRFDRLKNIQLTAMNAYNLLRVFMLDQTKN
jgi:nicotinamide-nucleotide amidase